MKKMAKVNSINVQDFITFKFKITKIIFKSKSVKLIYLHGKQY